MIEIIILSIVLFYFIISSYEDLKKREVYDYFTYSFILIIFSISIIDSYLSLTIDPVIYTALGMFFGFLLGYLLFLIGVWGGGDAKFLIGFSGSSYYLISLVSGISQNFRIEQVINILSTYLEPFFFSFFFNYLIPHYSEYSHFNDFLF